MANGRATHGTLAYEAEERCVRRKRTTTVLDEGDVAPDERRHPRSERHESGLAELGFSNDEESPVVVDIVELEARDLADAQAEAVEQSEDRSVRGTSQRRPRLIGKSPGEVEQPLHLRGVEDERESGRRPSAPPR